MTGREHRRESLPEADNWLSDARQVHHLHRLPARAGVTAEWPEWVSAAVRDACEATGITLPWRHQVEAAEHAWAGRHVSLTTGTASGKTLGYLLPILASTYQGTDPAGLADPGRSVGTVAGAGTRWSAVAWRQRPHTALYLAPAKALAHDQLRACRGLGLDHWRVAVVDGDSEAAERDWARDYATFILTNPDLLHYSLLPNHARWAGFLQSLRYVVVDEAHRYRGVFGAQVAAVLRRLRRLAEHYGARPGFVLASGTVANPVESSIALTGVAEEDLRTVSRDCSARGQVDVVFWRPDGYPDEEVSDLLARLVSSGRQTIAFLPSRRITELVARRARDVSRSEASIESYRSGYLALDRRRLERGLQDGTVRGLAATNALELGVDIAGVDAVLLCGYPGTRAAFWQQAGRAGRRGADALVVLVARPHPLDAYVFDHPEVLFDQPVEATVLYPENPHILGPQLAAAAQELPLTDTDRAYFGASTSALGDSMARRGVLRKRPDGWYWTSPARAVDTVDLRSTAGDSVDIVEESTGRVLGQVDSASADAAVHPGAVYLHLGDSYICDLLDREAGEALVRAARPGYLTQARGRTEIRAVRELARRPLGAGWLRHGEIVVETRITEYVRRDERTGLVWDVTPLDLPSRAVRTTGTWWSIATDETAARVSAAALDAAVHAAEHVCVGLLPAFSLCDQWDIGSSSVLDETDASVYIHDQQPGGAGFAVRAYEVAEEWLAAAAARLRTCDCRGGCPACIISVRCGARRALDKNGAGQLLQLLVDPA